MAWFTTAAHDIRGAAERHPPVLRPKSLARAGKRD